YKKILEELIKGPERSELYPTLPSSTRVISVEVEDGLATVNLSKEILTDTTQIPHSSITEVLAISSIVNTLTEFDEIKRVKIIVEGKDKGEIDGIPIEDFWGHVGIYEEFERNEKIIWK
ncbi:MAG: GerMN domain-containing protein, partial [Actinobacteria bacterium]|nr:GerMN domain-containing protein [Actinomycetota bacterium]